MIYTGKFMAGQSKAGVSLKQNKKSIYLKYRWIAIYKVSSVSYLSNGVISFRILLQLLKIA